MSKRLWAVTLVAFIVSSALIANALLNRAPDSIRIGYAISLSGENARGAEITVLSNYRLWAKQVNDAGGIMLKSINKRVPVEVIEYDDFSKTDKGMEAITRLIEVDKVDFILPPWGTGPNLVVAPLLHDAGYPHLATTAMSHRVEELTKRWPNSFWLMGTIKDSVQALVEMLDRLRSEGKIDNRIAIVNVADQFGIQHAEAARRTLSQYNFDIVYNRSYSVKNKSMTEIVTEVKNLNPDTFLAFSYPPDTMAITEESRSSNFNPKIFYTGVGTAYPLFEQHFGADAEGVMGIGGWNSSAPASMEYSKQHLAFSGQKPDNWASPITYASLQILQQAIEEVGAIDRKAVIKELRQGTFQTILGDIKFESNLNKRTWSVGQWHDGQFLGIAPANLPGAQNAIVPKPSWRAGS